jgi:hypothetical protein
MQYPVLRSARALRAPQISAQGPIEHLPNTIPAPRCGGYRSLPGFDAMRCMPCVPLAGPRPTSTGVAGGAAGCSHSQASAQRLRLSCTTQSTSASTILHHCRIILSRWRTHGSTGTRGRWAPGGDIAILYSGPGHNVRPHRPLPIDIGHGSVSGMMHRTEAHAFNGPSRVRRGRVSMDPRKGAGDPSRGPRPQAAGFSHTAVARAVIGR